MMPTLNDEGELDVAFGFMRGWDDLIYDEIADPDQDRVLMRIGDEIYTLPVVDAWYDREDDTEGAVVTGARTMLRALANAEQPVPVRFQSDYSGIERDYTMPVRMIDLYANGFARVCLD